MRSAYPDRDWDGRDGQTGPEGRDEGLFEAVMSSLEDYDRRIADREAEAKELSDLLVTDPRAAGLLSAWASGGDPMSFLLEEFGDEFRDALESDEGRARYLESYNKWLERRAKDKAGDEEREANFARSLDAIDAFGEANNLSDQQRVELLGRVNKIACDVIEGVYTEETLKAVHDAMNHDNDVAVAREEGAISGRNERIRQAMRDSKGPAGMPPSLGGQGSAVEERERPRRRSKASEMFGIGGQ